MKKFSDRVSDKPNRRKIKIESTGEEIFAEIEYADSPHTDCEGTPLNAETFNDLQNGIIQEMAILKNGKDFVFKTWQENKDSGNTALYKVVIPNSEHLLGASVVVANFNNNSDEFEWIKDNDGNITIFSNIIVDMTVNLK